MGDESQRADKVSSRRRTFLERLRSSRQSEEDTLREVYEEHAPELFRFALRSLRDRGLAEEVTQETFVRAWRSREKFDEGRGSRRTWLFAIARNLVIDTARARKSRPAPANAETAKEVEATEDHAEQTLRRMLVSEAMESLSEEHRFVIHEVHFRGRKYSEVAEEAGVPSGTLRSRMYYALRSLRLALEEMGWPDER